MTLVLAKKKDENKKKIDQLGHHRIKVFFEYGRDNSLECYSTPLTKGIFESELMPRFEEIITRKGNTAYTSQIQILIKSAFSKQLSANIFTLAILVFMAKSLLNFLKSGALQFCCRGLIKSLICHCSRISHH